MVEGGSIGDVDAPESDLEAGIRARLATEGLQPYGWSNGPGDRYAAHRHEYDKVIVVTRGDIVFGLPEAGTGLPLETGDRLDLPAGTLHDAIVGSRGVHCLEAHLEPGTLGRRAERRAGWAAGEP
jgi:uncharacterized protein YjlB